jgi:hypothetical protein
MIISPHMEREIRRMALAHKLTNSDVSPSFFLCIVVAYCKVEPEHDCP